jgi:hypothetical protein
MKKIEVKMYRYTKSFIVVSEMQKYAMIRLGAREEDFEEL